MTQHQARSRAVIPGVAILGTAGAKREQFGQLGGSVVPGKAILGEEGAVAEANRLAAARDAAAIVADPKAKTGPAEPVAPLVSRHGSPRDQPPAALAIPAGMSEQEALEALKADANSWERVLQLEVARPEGVRIAVARAILKAAPRAKITKVPKAVIARLKALLVDASAVEPAVRSEAGPATE